jgi:predicted secreted hydrolase
MSAQADWRLALPGWSYEFPRDHQNHPEFKTEWWYFLETSTPPMVEFGYQLTFFRQG